MELMAEPEEALEDTVLVETAVVMVLEETGRQFKFIVEREVVWQLSIVVEEDFKAEILVEEVLLQVELKFTSK